jgi:hypothetical protein
MYMTGLTYDWDNETPWEITDGRQLPMYTNVDMNLGWVGTSKPKAQQSPFSYDFQRNQIPWPTTGESIAVPGDQTEADLSPTPSAYDKSLDPTKADPPKKK